MYFDEYNDFSDTNKTNMNPKFDPINLILDEYDLINDTKKIIKKN